MLGSLLIVILLVVLIATIPAWPYSRNWGYVPTGAIAVLLVVILILVFSGYLAVTNPFAPS